MGQVLHGSASTTAEIRRAIQNSQESLRVAMGPFEQATTPVIWRSIRECSRQGIAHVTRSA